MNNVFPMKHALVEHFVCTIRDRRTSSEVFRATVRRLATLLAYEATKDLRTTAVELMTPLASARGYRLADRIGLIPILRAGLAMVDAISEFLPDAETWHLGFYRNERTLDPVEYYKKLPPSDPVDVALVLDPMLATGGSAVAAVKAVHDWGVRRVKFLALIGAPEGIERLSAAFPDTTIHIAAIDRQLNDQGYIVPGLGDAGDRIFNTQPAQ